MHLVKSPHINQVIMISPTEPSNHSFEGWVPAPLIWYAIKAPPGTDMGRKSKDSADAKMAFLRLIIDRQTMSTGLYKTHNKVEKFATLITKLTPEVAAAHSNAMNRLDSETRQAVSKIRRRGFTPGKTKEVLEKFNAEFDVMRCKIHKMFINQDLKNVWNHPDIRQEERQTIYFMNVNPNLLLIFDDCAADLKPLFTKPEFRMLFYQPRHISITNIFTFQDDTDLNANLRKQAYCAVFTTAAVCRAYFEKNSFSKEDKARANAIIPAVYGQEFQKVAYLRDDPQKNYFYRFTAKMPEKFMFGSPACRELCERVADDDGGPDEDNPYFDSFHVNL
jgi:hypothetical protein